MRTKNGNLHLEIQTSRKNPVGLIRTTYWDKRAKTTKHTQHGRITGCTIEQLQMLQCAFREEVSPIGDLNSMEILKSRELGASQAVLSMAKEIGLHRILYSRSEPWVDRIIAMIVGRVVYQGSKLSLCNQWQNTCLWELCGVHGRPDVEKHCYKPMDRLLERQKAIQKKLASKHLNGGSLVLYDITSTYFEGEYKNSKMVKFGYNRDGKKGHTQVVVGLITNAKGCPVGCEVFEGNTSDVTTVMDKIDEIRHLYKLEHFIFVGDRGMVTQGRFEMIRELGSINTISALTHAQLKTLLDRKVVQMELFDKKNIAEVIDPEDNGLRYCLCKNPVTEQKERKTRKRLIELTSEGLEYIAHYKKRTTVEKLGARVGKLLAKYKMGKFVTWSIHADAQEEKSSQHELVWTFNREKIAQEERIDGCYIIRTDVAAGTMDTAAIVETYKSLGHVERAFRNLKTVQLEMRPVFHKTDDRISAHIFLCVLAYYVQWHMQQRLQPLFTSDGEGSERRWTFTGVIDRLKQTCRHDVKMNGVEYQQDTQYDEEQQMIINLLNQKA